MFQQTDVDQSPILATALVKLRAAQKELSKQFGHKYRYSYVKIPEFVVGEPNVALEIKSWKLLNNPLFSVGCTKSGSWFFVLYKDGRIDPRLKPWVSICEFMSKRYKVYFANDNRVVWR